MNSILFNMKKFKIFVLFLSLIMMKESFGLDVLDLRKNYYAAVTDAKKTEDLYNQLVNSKSNNPIVIAYIGSLQALKAKHSWNPYQKLSLLAESQKTLDKAISLSPNNVEIRFLRYTIQYYVPTFLGQSKNLDDDRTKIIYLINKKLYQPDDKSLMKNIVAFMGETNKCTAEELEMLQKGIS